MYLLLLDPTAYQRKNKINQSIDGVIMLHDASIKAPRRALTRLRTFGPRRPLPGTGEG
jgi:hypothetical protein